jgi:ABC-type amino acid transport substrate-binding protein
MFRTAALAIAVLVATAVQAQGIDGRLKKIAATKTITIASRTDATPFSFVDEKKQVAGFSIDLCKQVVKSIQSQLKLPNLEVKWLPVTVQTRFAAITSGKADMECGSTTVTLTRMKTLDFSSYIFLETTGLAVKSASGLRSFADLAGKKIAVIGGTTNERAVKVQLAYRKMNATVVPVKSQDEGFAAVESGKADAFASDKLLLMGGSMRAKDVKSLEMLADDLSFEPYAITLPRGESALRLAVNTGLAKIYGSGEINEIFARWFGALGKPSPVVESIYLLGAIPE